MTEYTAATANATDELTATPHDAKATVTVELNGEEITEDPEWDEGENELTVTVEKASMSTAYTVTVTYTPGE